MNGNVDKVAALNARLRQLPQSAKRLTDAGEEIRPGQLWLLRQSPVGDDLTWAVLVEEMLEDGLFNVLPCFRWLELAGPDDLILPARLAGAPLAVSFELEATLDRDALGECRERLSDDAMAFVRSARASLQNETARLGYNWGLGYLGEHGVRQNWHEKINRVLETLQEGGRRLTFADAGEDYAIVEGPSYRWSAFAERMERYQLPNAAQTDEEYTPIVRGDGQAQGRTLVAKVERFVRLQAGLNAGLCCEWSVEGETAAKSACVFFPGIEMPLGHAYVKPQEGGMLVFLENVEWPAEIPPPISAIELRIVLDS